MTDHAPADPTLTASGSTEVVNVRTSPRGSYVYVGRFMPGRFPASPFGNPFKLPRNATASDRRRCLEDYRAWLLGRPELMARLPELKGRRLGCWCHPEKCHGDVLAELADEREGGPR